MSSMEKIKSWLADDAAEIRRAGPEGGLRILKAMGGWSVIIRAYFKAAGEPDPNIEQVHELRRWAQMRVADYRDEVLV